MKVGMEWSLSCLVRKKVLEWPLLLESPFLYVEELPFHWGGREMTIPFLPSFWLRRKYHFRLALKIPSPYRSWGQGRRKAPCHRWEVYLLLQVDLQHDTPAVEPHGSWDLSSWELRSLFIHIRSLQRSWFFCFSCSFKFGCDWLHLLLYFLLWWLVESLQILNGFLWGSP